MAQKIKKTIKKVGYKMHDETGTSVIKWLPSTEAGGREYTADPRGEAQDIYADGIKVYSDNGNDGYDVKLTLLAVTDDVSADWLNEIKDTKGVAEYADGKEYPYFDLFLIEDTTDGIGKTTIYYNCQCSTRPSISGKTKEGASFDAQFPEYAISATPRETDNLVRYIIDGKTEFAEVPEPTAVEIPAEG